MAGGLIGSATEEGLTRTQGVEITVREDDGSRFRKTKYSALASGYGF
jgi:outer membrane lipoprotein SlyB